MPNLANGGGNGGAPQTGANGQTTGVNGQQGAGTPGNPNGQQAGTAGTQTQNGQTGTGTFDQCSENLLILTHR